MRSSGGVHGRRRLEKRAQRALVASHFLRAARHRIAADPIIFVRQVIGLAGFFLLS